MSDLIIRTALASDGDQILSLYPAAFPDEDLLPIVRALSAERRGVLSLVAVQGVRLVGQVFFTDCGIDGSTHVPILLGPLAVDPAFQRSGVGSQLVKTGLSMLKASGSVEVLVLGDPDYYGRFGFRPNAIVEPPYRIPDAWRPAWQYLPLDGRAEGLAGMLTVPAPWQDPALWAG